MAYIKVSEAAARLGVTNVTIREYIRRKRLVATRTPGGQFRIEESALADMMAKPRDSDGDGCSSPVCPVHHGGAGPYCPDADKPREKAQNES